MSTSPLVYIIVLNWNGWEHTQGCLESLLLLQYPRFRILVVDNGSTDDSALHIRQNFPHIDILETGENLGFSEGNNRGIIRALEGGADYVLLLNNDTEVDPLLVNAFVSQAQLMPEAGILGGHICLYGDRTRLDHLGGMWNARHNSFDLIGCRENSSSWQEVLALDYVCGCAFFVARSVFEKVGLLDPRFFLIWEESDLCFRARLAGYGVFSIPSARVWHKVSASFVGGKPHGTYFWYRNRLLWVEKNSPHKKTYLFYKDLIQFSKLYFLKKFQFFWARHMGASTAAQEIRFSRLRIYRAALCGILDYRRRRFGNGPSWIYKSRF